MAKGRPRGFDSERALDTALTLFWEHGYEGVSVARLAQAMGINIPSLYAAFGNKERLFIRAVEHYCALNGALYHDALAKPTAREVAQAVLDGEVALVTQPNRPDGCLMVQGALVTSPASEPLRLMMSRLRATAEGWMRDRFARARDEGDLPPDADPAALACYLMTLNSGLAVQARSGVPRAQLEQVVALAMRNWPRPV